MFSADTLLFDFWNVVPFEGCEQSSKYLACMAWVMDKNLDWKLICPNMAKTQSFFRIARHKRHISYTQRKPRPAITDKMSNVTTSSQQFSYCIFLEIFNVLRMAPIFSITPKPVGNAPELVFLHQICY